MRSITSFVGDARTVWVDDRTKILLAIAAGWFLSIGVRLVYPVLLPYIQSEYGLSLTASGMLLTVLWLAYALGQLPGGILADRIGERAIFVVSSVVAAATLAAIVFSDSVFLLYAATGLFGLGTALFGVARLSALSDVYPDRLGAAVGIVAAVGDAGNTLLPPLAGVLAAAVAWQLGFGFVVPLFIVVAVGLWVAVPSRTSEREAADDPFSIENVRHVLKGLRQRPIVLIALIQLLSNSVWQAFTGFYPTYLIEVKGLSPSVASGLFALFFALGIVIKPLAGGAYDRVGARKSLFALALSFGVALALLPYVSGLWALAGVTVLVSTLLGRATVELAYMTDQLPDDILNTGLGTIRTGYMTLAAGSPILIGAIADRGFFDEAFLLLAAVTGIALFLVAMLPEI